MSNAIFNSNAPQNYDTGMCATSGFTGTGAVVWVHLDIQNEPGTYKVSTCDGEVELANARMAPYQMGAGAGDAATLMTRMATKSPRNCAPCPEANTAGWHQLCKN